MKLIKLSQGKFAQVDDEDYEYLSKWNWCAHKGAHTFYAVRTFKDYSGHKMIYMHREVLKAKNGEIIDHKDHIGTNCQKLNLRIAARSQNAANRKSMSFASSKYLGVHLHRTKFKYKNKITNYSYWICVLKKQNIVKFKKYFKTEVEAALAYNKAAIKYHGEFSNLNIIE